MSYALGGHGEMFQIGKLFLINSASNGPLGRFGRAAMIAGLSVIAPAWAHADNVLIVNGSSRTGEPATTSSITSNLSGKLSLRGNDVTVSDGLTANLGGYSQVWDLRFSNSSPLSTTEQSQYMSFMNNGGKLFVMGENSSFPTRNTSILSLINSAGGGTITLSGERSVATQTLADGSGSVTYRAADVALSAGAGQYLSTLPNGAGSAVAWQKGRLASAPNGALAVVFDVNFMQLDGSAGEQALLNQVLGLIERGVVVVLNDTRNGQQTIVKDTTEIKLRSTVRSIVDSIGSRVASVTSGVTTGRAAPVAHRLTGLNAGDAADLPISVWSDFTRSSFRDRSPGDSFNGATSIALAGVDYLVAEGAVVGVVVGVESSDISLKTANGDSSAQGHTAVLYGGYRFLPFLGVDAQIGYSKMSNDLVEQQTGTPIQSNFGSRRVFGAVNLSANYAFDNLKLNGGVGYLFASEKFNEYTTSSDVVVNPSRVRLGQTAVKAEVGYQFESAFPFMRASYEIDTLSKKNDRTGGKIGAGVRLAPVEQLSVLLAGDAVVGRRYERNVSLNASVRYTF